MTLVGTAGIGKTRLALAAAAALEATLRDGAVFVSLAPIDDPSLVLPSVSQALGVRASTRAWQDRLVYALRDRQLLLVLDNFEQVLPAAPSITSLLNQCRELRVLVTSRSVASDRRARLLDATARRAGPGDRHCRPDRDI